MTRPGVDVLVSSVAALPPSGLDTAAPYGIVGQFDRGPTDRAVLVQSPAEFVTVYGPRTTYSTAWDDAMLYFREGGQQLYVVRIVGTTPVLATILTAGAAAAASLRWDATSAGAWANGYKVEISTGTLPSTQKVKVFDPNGNLAEGPIDNIADLDAFVTANSQLTLVKAVKIGTVIPVNTAAGGVALASGADDRATIVGQNNVPALDLFTADLGPMAIAIPGVAASTATTSSTVGAVLIAHCVANRRICYLTAAVGASQSTALALAATFRSGNGRVAAVLWPDLTVVDGGVTRTIAPCGFVAAKRAQTHQAKGPAQPPAGVRYGLSTSGVITGTSIGGVASSVTAANGEILNSGSVSAIRVFPRGVALYGYRSLSTDPNYRMLQIADLGNVIARDAENQGQDLVFESIDGLGQLLSRWKSRLTAVMEEYRTRGQVLPRRNRTTGGQVLVDPGYIVDVDNVNTPTTAANNELVGSISYRPPGNAEHVQINISMVPVAASLS